MEASSFLRLSQQATHVPSDGRMVLDLVGPLAVSGESDALQLELIAAGLEISVLDIHPVPGVNGRLVPAAFVPG